MSRKELASEGGEGRGGEGGQSPRQEGRTEDELRVAGEGRCAQCVQGMACPVIGREAGGDVVQCDRTGRGTGAAMKSRGWHSLIGEAAQWTSPWSKGGCGRVKQGGCNHVCTLGSTQGCGQRTRELQCPEEGRWGTGCTAGHSWAGGTWTSLNSGLRAAETGSGEGLGMNSPHPGW